MGSFSVPEAQHFCGFVRHALFVLGAKLIRAAASQTASAAAWKHFLKGNSAGVFTIGGSLALGMLFWVTIVVTVSAAAAWRLIISLVCLLFASSVGFSFVFSPGCFPGALACRRVQGLRIAEGSISLMLPSRRPLFGGVLGLRLVEGNISLMLPFCCVLLLFKCIGEQAVGLATTTVSKGPSYAAAAAATPRVDVEKDPQAAAALDCVDQSSQVPSSCLFQKHPDFLFDKIEQERKERTVREDGGDTVLLVRGLQGNTVVVQCGSGSRLV